MSMDRSLIDPSILKKIENDDPNLIELNLIHQKLTLADIQLLLNALEKNSHLTKLNLTNNGLGDDGAKLLAKKLRINHLILAANHITDEGAITFVENKALSILDLSYNQLKDASAEMLAQSTTLTSLILRDNFISSSGVIGFAHNTSLLSLDLTDNLINHNGATFLAQNNKLASLTLTGNPLKDTGAIALAQNKTFTSLTLRGCYITADGVKALARHPKLTNLNLNYNQISVQGALILAQSTTLNSLLVAGNQISNEGAAAFASNKSLVSLDLSYNQINDGGAVEVAKNTTLKHLNLSHNQINLDGSEALASNTALTSLNLSYNLMIGDNGAAAFSQNDTLVALDLTGDRVGYEGAYAFVKNKKLARLVLSANIINDAGAIFLARNHTLSELLLTRNAIADAGAIAFSENTTLKVLSLSYNPISSKGRKLLAEHKSLDKLILVPQQLPETVEGIFDKSAFLLAQDYLCIMGFDGSLQFSNPAFSRVLSYSDDELVVKPILDLVHPGERTNMDNLLKNRESHPRNHENRYLCKDGCYRLIRWTFEIKYDRIYAVGSDITENLRTEKILDMADKQVSEVKLEEAKIFDQKQTDFIAQLCHEIRNPLMAINGLIELLKDNLKHVEGFIKSSSDDHLRTESEHKFLTINDNISDLLTCTKHQKSILDDNLDLAKITGKQLALKHETLDLRKVIHNSIAMYSAIAAQKGLTFTSNIPEKDIMVKGDATRIKQILVNLISNSIKFTEQGGVTIKLMLVEEAPQTTTCKIEIIDTGIGMTNKEIEQLFKRFSQTTGNQYSGSGLGLYISKLLAQLMNGDITVQSEKDKSTTFTCTIRLENAPKSEKKKEKQEYPLTFIPPAPTSSQKKILVADDNAINRKIILAHLIKAGYECLQASDGIEALTLYEQQAPDAILMDMMMPKMDGLTAIIKIREKEQSQGNIKTPIIAITANALEKDRIKTLAAGADDYITKPFKKEELYEKLQCQLKEKSLLATLPSLS